MELTCKYKKTAKKKHINKDTGHSLVINSMEKIIRQGTEEEEFLEGQRNEL